MHFPNLWMVVSFLGVGLTGTRVGGILDLSKWKQGACPSRPCLEGLCINTNSSYHCFCRSGYTGLHCDSNHDECKSDPCLNNSTCIDGEDDFFCDCPPGFKGKQCEVDIDECLSNPCLSGGVCSNKINGYHCSCARGYSGINCELKESVCQQQEADQCLNGATCVDRTRGHFTCSCPGGYTGIRCEVDINECINNGTTNPCLNGGLCRDYVGHFHCICPSGYVGNICERKLTVNCEVNVCQNNGQCLTERVEPVELLNISVPEIHCFCVPDFHGKRCENQYDDCDPNPCQNNGMCVDGVNDYTCQCPDGFSGKQCHINCLQNNYTILGCDLTSAVATSSTALIATSFPDSSAIETSFFSMSSDFSSPSGSSLPLPSPSLPFSSSYGVISSPDDSYFWSSTSFSLFESSVQPSLSLTPTPARESFEPPKDNKKVFTPRFDGKSSSLTIPLEKRSFRRHLFIELGFKSGKENGTLLYSRTDHNSTFHLLLYLDNNWLKFAFSCGLQSTVLANRLSNTSHLYFSQINIDLWLEKNDTCRVKFVVNGSHPLYGTQSLNYSSNILCFDHFHLGNVLSEWGQNWDNAPQDLSPFEGCIRHFRANGQQWFVGKTEAVNITECEPRSVCQEKPCINGVCEAYGEEGWSCLCEEGFGGSFCEESTCWPNPCRNSGDCVVGSEGQVTCICFEGHFGPRCQWDWNGLNRPALSFQGNSYAVLVLSSHLQFLGLRFRFITHDVHQKHAPLLFMGQQNAVVTTSIRSDHLSVNFHEEHVVLKINLGHGTQILYSKLDSKVLIHSVYVGHYKQNIWLIVDEQPKRLSKTPGSLTALNVNSDLLVGGYRNISLSPDDASRGFRGCIFNIQYKVNQSASFRPMESILLTHNTQNCKELEKKCGDSGKSCT